MLSHWNLKISWDQMFTSKLDGQMIPHMLSASVKGEKKSSLLSFLIRNKLKDLKA